MVSSRRRSDALGQSEAFLSFQERLSRAAKVDRPVLILGERGVGKELVASRLHYLSTRWGGPLVTLNCAALSETLIESELFGHESGAFTGAVRSREGRFEMADSGTLFLDEIGLIPMVAQEKILRTVEYSVFERVGGAETKEVDVRIIGATNVDLSELARAGKFKEDLLDRLSFEALHVPPLRDREGDIPLLAFHFAAQMATELGYSNPPEFTDEAMSALESHSWPGNVRELKNVVERAVYRHEGGPISDVDLDPFRSPFDAKASRVIGQAKGSSDANRDRPEAAANPQGRANLNLPMNLRDEIADLERRAVEAALREANHKQNRAAELLGLSYHQFRGLLRKRQIQET